MELSERKEKILAAVVEQYIKTGEPVGSKALLDSLDMSVSSATVRNEMADLGYLGLLDQPHTSAGRVPTGEGYRYYVDNLVPESELSEESRRLIDAGIGNANGDPESLLRHAGEALAYLTQCAAVMPTPLSLTEKQAFVNLQALAKDSIVLLISHRLYLFPEMDGVIWMENGKAVTGTHEELLKTVPEYENLYTSQVHTTENGGAEHDAQKTSENGDL